MPRIGLLLVLILASAFLIPSVRPAGAAPAPVSAPLPTPPIPFTMGTFEAFLTEKDLTKDWNDLYKDGMFFNYDSLTPVRPADNTKYTITKVDPALVKERGFCGKVTLYFTYQGSEWMVVYQASTELREDFLRRKFPFVTLAQPSRPVPVENPELPEIVSALMAMAMSFMAHRPRQIVLRLVGRNST